MTEPLKAEIGFSYEMGVDVDLGTPEEPQWQPIRFCKAVAPNVTPKEIDAQTYDDLGADHPVKLGEAWGLGLTVQMQRQEDGKYLPEVESLLNACAPDATGDEATRRFRVYDKPAPGQAPNPTDAYMGTGTVSVTREQTGTAEIAGWQFEIKGQGPRKRITNPLSEKGKPVVTKVEPARAAVGDQVTISGAGLGKATKVVFGSTTAKHTIIGDKIVATVPTGANGSSPVKVTNAAGTSEGFAFTVS